MTEEPNILVFRRSHDGFLKPYMLNEMSQLNPGTSRENTVTLAN